MSVRNVAVLFFVALSAVPSAIRADDPPRSPDKSVDKVVAVVERFRVSGAGLREFLLVNKEFLLISAFCKKADGGFACRAYSALRRASLTLIADLRRGGADPGALLCQRLGGTLLSGQRDDVKTRSESLFCQFEDKSVVDTDTLHAHALLNDNARDEAPDASTQDGDGTPRRLKSIGASLLQSDDRHPAKPSGERPRDAE